MVGLKKIHRWNFRELVRPRGFEPLTFGIGMQNNRAYIARAIVYLFGVMRRPAPILLLVQYVRLAPFVTLYADGDRRLSVPASDAVTTRAILVVGKSERCTMVSPHALVIGGRLKIGLLA